MDDPSRGTQGSQKQDLNRKVDANKPQRSGGTEKPEGGKSRTGMEEEE